MENNITIICPFCNGLKRFDSEHTWIVCEICKGHGYIMKAEEQEKLALIQRITTSGNN